MATGYSASGYQQSFGSLSLDSTINDGNAATGPNITGGFGPSLTGGLDFGSSLLFNGVTYTVGYANTLSLALEYSVSGTSWTALSTGTAPHNGGVFGLWSDVVTANFTARYIRLSVIDLGGAGQISIREMAADGPNAYLEYPIVRAGSFTSGADGSAFADAITVKAGGKPSGTDTSMHGGGGASYDEPNLLVKGAGKPSGADSATAHDAGTAPSAGLPSGEEFQRNTSIPSDYYDAPIVFAGSKPSGTATVGFHDAPQANSGAKPSGSDSSAVANTVTVKAGSAAPGTSANGYFELPLVKSGGLPSGVDTLVAADVGTGKSGGKPSEADAQAFYEVGLVSSAGKPSGADNATAHEALLTMAGGNVAQSLGVQAALSTGTVKSGSLTSGADSALVSDSGTGKAGSKPSASTSEPRGYADVVMVSAGSRPYGSDTATAGE